MDDPFLTHYPHLTSLFPEGLPLCELGPGSPHPAARSKLKGLTDAELFDGRPVKSRTLARCCLAGLWLVFDYLEESHAISQELSTVEGSYWHGIMHRREPDYGNAKYWFHRVPRHPVFEHLGQAARKLCANHKNSDPYAHFLEHEHTWDAPAFIDLCQSIANRKARCEALARDVAMAEWRLLFAFCYEGAVGS
jgi:hypothetical protein